MYNNANANDKDRSATPIEFRDMLLNIAASVALDVHAARFLPVDGGLMYKPDQEMDNE